MQEMQETPAPSLYWEDPLEKETAIPSNILTWEIPWTEEPGRLESMGSQKSWTGLKRRSSSSNLVLEWTLGIEQ